MKTDIIFQCIDHSFEPFNKTSYQLASTYFMNAQRAEIVMTLINHVIFMNVHYQFVLIFPKHKHGYLFVIYG